VLAASGAGATPRLQHVTIVGDSVAGSLAWEPTARAILTAHNDVDFELAACRRLATPSCFVTGMTPPPTALQTLTQLGRAVGPTVVMDVGYNDGSNEYAGGMDAVLRLLRENGVQHVVWLTLRAAQHDYMAINEEIRAAARTRPWMSVADWNRYSRSHGDWFQSDGIHLEAAGADALAVFIHRTLVRLHLTGPVGGPLTIATQRLPGAEWLGSYAVRLRASGGTPPYRWRAVHLPQGLELSPSGRLAGTLAQDVPTGVVVVSVRDRAGARAERAYALRVKTN
jgi:hypothetical protein